MCLTSLGTITVRSLTYDFYLTLNLKRNKEQDLYSKAKLAVLPDLETSFVSS